MYLSVLPIRRGALWFALLGAHGFAALISAVPIFFLRRGLAELLTARGSDQGPAGPWVLSTLPVFFATGAMLSLNLRKPFSVYIAGFVTTAAVLLESFGFSQYANADLAFNDPSCKRWELALAAYTGVTISLSGYFFGRGEPQAPRRRIKNVLILCLAFLTLWTIAFLATMYPEVLKKGNSWVLDEGSAAALDQFASYKSDISRSSAWAQRYRLGRPPRERFLSPSGRYLIVIETLASHFERSQLNVVDLKRGKLISTRKLRGLFWASWAGNDDVIEVLTWTRSSACIFCLGGTTRTRLSRSCKILSSVRFPQTMVVGDGAADTEMLVVRDRERTSVLTLDGSKNTAEELVHGPSAFAAGISDSGTGTIIIRLQGVSGAWVVENHRVAQTPDFAGGVMLPPEIPYFVFGKILDRGSAQHELAKAYPMPARDQRVTQGFIILPASKPLVVHSAQDGRPFFLTPRCQKCGVPGQSLEPSLHSLLVKDSTKIFRTDIFALSAWNGTRWRPLGNIAYTVYAGQKGPSTWPPYAEPIWESYIDFQRGIAAYQRNRDTFLYDATIDQEIPLSECAGETEISRASRPSNLLLICDQHLGQDRLFRGLLYQPGSGKIKESFSWIYPPVLTGATPLRFETNGSSIWNSTHEIFRVTAHGKVLKIWPADPP